MFPLGTSLSLCFSYIAQCKCFEYRFGEMDSHTSVTEFQVFLICLPGIAILGESSWSQGDSEILEPGKKEMKSWKFCSMKCFIVLFGYFMLHSFYFFFLSFFLYNPRLYLYLNRKPFTHKMHHSMWWSQATSWWSRTSSTSRGSNGSTWFWMRPRHWKAAPGKTHNFTAFSHWPNSTKLGTKGLNLEMRNIHSHAAVLHSLRSWCNCRTVKC